MCLKGIKILKNEFVPINSIFRDYLYFAGIRKLISKSKPTNWSGQGISAKGPELGNSFAAGVAIRQGSCSSSTKLCSPLNESQHLWTCICKNHDEAYLAQVPETRTRRSASTVVFATTYHSSMLL